VLKRVVDYRNTLYDFQTMDFHMYEDSLLLFMAERDICFEAFRMLAGEKAFPLRGFS